MYTPSAMDVGPSSLFEDDVLFPDQMPDFRRFRPPAEPERLLMLAVMKDAMLTYRRFATQAKGVGRKQFEEVERWIASTDSTWLYSFESICGAFGLEPEAVRREVASWRLARERESLCEWRRVAGSRRGDGERGWKLRKIG